MKEVLGLVIHTFNLRKTFKTPLRCHGAKTCGLFQFDILIDRCELSPPQSYICIREKKSFEGKAHLQFEGKEVS